MKFGVVFKGENKKAREVAKKAAEYLRSESQQVLDKKNLRSADFIVTLGGDGTLIHAACEYAPLKIPLVGINVGKLGFLTAAEGDGWQKALDQLIAGTVFISERITLEAEVVSGSRSLVTGKNKPATSNQQPATSFRAVNEAAIKGFLRIIDLEIGVNWEKFLKIIGDGVIISTQTGSTAYSLSSGGPIVDPKLNCLLITPINPIGLPIPSVVVSPDDEILVKVVSGDGVSLIIDGQEHTKLSQGQSVRMQRGKYNVKFAYFDKEHFIKSLDAKFGLAIRSIGK